MDLHLRPAVPERRRRAAEQAAVELRRRGVAHDRLARGDRLTAREPDAAREDALDVGAGLAGAALLADVRDERVGELRTAADRDRHPALLHRDGDHLRHVARGGRVGPEPGVQHPGREHAVRPLRGERLLQPVARRDEQLPGELPRAVATEPPHRLPAERGAVTRPEVGAEHAEGEVGVREEPREHPLPLRPELGDVCLGAAEQEPALPVRERGRRRHVRVHVLEPVAGELTLEPGMHRPAHPEGMPRAEDVVPEAGPGQLGGLDRAAEPVVPLEHAHVPAASREQRRTGEAVDARADDDGVVLSHRRST